MRSPVLITGAGPTGLTLAVELARRGLAVRLIDAAAEPNQETRALGVQPRSLELFERQGIVPELLERGLKTHSFSVFSEGEQIIKVDLSRLDTPFPYLLFIPQQATEAVLEAKLAELGVHVERSVRLTGFSQDGDGVDARLQHADGTAEQTRADWMIGCDGAHSTVRSLLGLEFLGAPFEENFAVADLRMDWPLPHDEFFAFQNRGHFVAYFPMLDGFHRVAVAHPSGDAPTGDVTYDELQAAVDRCAPAGSRIVEIRQSGRFRINQRRVERHAVGRVFLAGDAAHIHSVVGAQGMNTGIQDAFNLAWKLAAVINDEAAADLLDTYGAERSPVTRRLVRGTRTFTRITLLRNPVSTAVRRNVAPLVLGRSHVRDRIARAISQLDVSYHDHTGSGPAGRADVGDRAPARTLDDLRLFAPDKHTLLAFGITESRLRTALGDLPIPVHLRSITDAAIRRRYGFDGSGLVLIRPDSYIAFRADGTAVDGLVRHLDQTFKNGAPVR